MDLIGFFSRESFIYLLRITQFIAPPPVFKVLRIFTRGKVIYSYRKPIICTFYVSNRIIENIRKYKKDYYYIHFSLKK